MHSCYSSWQGSRIRYDLWWISSVSVAGQRETEDWFHNGRVLEKTSMTEISALCLLNYLAVEAFNMTYTCNCVLQLLAHFRFSKLDHNFRLIILKWAQEALGPYWSAHWVEIPKIQQIWSILDLTRISYANRWLQLFNLLCLRQWQAAEASRLSVVRPDVRPLSFRLFVRALTRISHDAVSLHLVDGFRLTCHKYSSHEWALLKRFPRLEVRGQGYFNDCLRIVPCKCTNALT